MPPPPRLAAAALVLNSDGKLLVGQRSGSHGAGSWQLPGGHVEDGEGLLCCAARETAEETGLVVEGGRVVATTYDVFAREAKHYITFFVVCRLRDPQAVPEAREPTKCAQWLWKTPAELQRLDMFLPLQTLFRRTPDLGRLLQGAGPVITLPGRVVTVRWDAERAVGGPLLHGDVLDVAPGADIAIVSASADCSVAIVVDDGQGTVAWPLGRDVLVVSPPVRPGAAPKTSSLMKELYMPGAPS